jgi:hypothetical protein
MITHGWLRAILVEPWWGLHWLQRRNVLGFLIDYETKPKPDWKERLQKGEVDPVAVQLWERAHHKGHETSVVNMFSGITFDHNKEFAMLPRNGVEVLFILGEKDSTVKPKEFERLCQRWDGWGLYMRLKELDMILFGWLLMKRHVSRTSSGQSLVFE